MTRRELPEDLPFGMAYGRTRGICPGVHRAWKIDKSTQGILFLLCSVTAS